MIVITIVLTSIYGYLYTVVARSYRRLKEELAANPSSYDPIATEEPKDLS
jgi:hypothetical protein